MTLRSWRPWLQQDQATGNMKDFTQFAECLQGFQGFGSPMGQQQSARQYNSLDDFSDLSSIPDSARDLGDVQSVFRDDTYTADTSAAAGTDLTPHLPADSAAASSVTRQQDDLAQWGRGSGEASHSFRVMTETVPIKPDFANLFASYAASPADSAAAADSAPRLFPAMPQTTEPIPDEPDWGALFDAASDSGGSDEELLESDDAGQLLQGSALPSVMAPALHEEEVDSQQQLPMASTPGEAFILSPPSAQAATDAVVAGAAAYLQCAGAWVDNVMCLCGKQ